MNSADGTGRQVRRRLTRAGTSELGRGCHGNSRGERTVFPTNIWNKWLSSQRERPSVLFSPTGRWARRSAALRDQREGGEKQSPPRGEARESRGCPGPLSSFPKSTPPGQARGTHLTSLAWGHSTDALDQTRRVGAPARPGPTRKTQR